MWNLYSLPFKIRPTNFCKCSAFDINIQPGLRKHPLRLKFSSASCAKTHFKEQNVLSLTLCSSNLRTNSSISANCLTRACWVSRCCVGVISPEHSSPRILGTMFSAEQQSHLLPSSSSFTQETGKCDVKTVKKI